MARTTQPNVPPSQQAQYSQIITTQQPVTSPQWQTTAASTRYDQKQQPKPYPILDYAQAAAEYIQIWRATDLQGRERLDFISARKAEIMNGSFPVEWWQEQAPIYDLTARVIPTCVLDTAHVAPPYRDPLRRASWCQAYYSDMQYANPAPHSGLPTPSAGWFGDVQATQFKDRWWAERTWAFAGGGDYYHRHNNPFFLWIEITMDLYASSKPNNFWPSWDMVILNTYYSPGYYKFPFHGTLKPKFRYRLPLSPAATPWAQTITTKMPYDIRRYEGRGSETPQNSGFIQVLLMPMPPHGRYFSNNDSCGCWFTASVRCFQALPIR